MKVNKAVVIGCGKIGALYDIDNNLVLTHAKGYHLSKLTNLQYVVDRDENVSKRVSKEYNCEYRTDYRDINFDEIDIVSICVPTQFHFEILKYLQSIQYSSIVILEKPVVATDNEIELLEDFDQEFLDNIYVNYIRSFDRDYREIFHKLKRNDYSSIEYIEVNYFGEFEHSAVHAFNLVNGLFDAKPAIKYADSKNVILDYDGIDVSFRSLSTKYLNYDITIYSETHKTCFNSLGYKVEIYEKRLSRKFKNTHELGLIFEKSILDGYITNLIEIIFDKSINKPTIYDGIEDLKLVKEIKYVSNYTS